MKRLIFFWSLLSTMSFALMASSGVNAADTTAQPVVKVTDAKGLEFSLETNGKLAYDAKKGQKVFVLFRGSAELTGLLAKVLAAGGAQLEADR